MRCSTGKVIHTSKGRAVVAIKSQPEKCLAVYRCKTCGMWHLTQDRKGGARFQQFMDRVLTADRQRGQA